LAGQFREAGDQQAQSDKEKPKLPLAAAGFPYSRVMKSIFILRLNPFATLFYQSVVRMSIRAFTRSRALTKS
jgi:hypothetical protein